MNAFLLPISFMMILIYIWDKFDIFKALAYSIIVWTTIVFAVTIGLSTFGLINRFSLLISWLAICFVIVIFIIKKVGCRNLKYKCKNTFNRLENLWKNYSIIEKIIFALVIFMISITLFMTVFTVPNNSDSMGYHLARLAQWEQNQSVNRFLAIDDRQTFMPVLSEYILLHSYILSRGDLFVNFLQYFAYIGTAIFLYKISINLGITRKFALISSVLFLMMPMAIGQSITTQVDLNATLWTVLSIYLILDIIKQEKLFVNREIFIKVAFLAFSISFAYMVKGSVCIILGVFLCWMIVNRIKKRDSLKVLAFYIFISIFIGILLISEQFIRNYLDVGNFTGTNASVVSDVFIGSYSPKYLFMNLYKNISMEFFQNSIVGVNDALFAIGRIIASTFDIDINDSIISFSSNYYDTGSSLFYFFHHDHAGNAVVSTLGIISLIYLLISRVCKSKIKNQVLNETFVFSMLSVVSLILLAMLIKWQPWVTRLLLPALALICVVVSYACDKVSQKHKVQDFILGGLICISISGMLNTLNYNIRPSITNIITDKSREELYFYYHPEYVDDYYSMVELIKDSENKNLAIDGRSAMEYPIWRWFSNSDYHIENISIENEQWNYEYKPNCIMSFVKNEYYKNDIIKYKGISYTCVWTNQQNDIAVLIANIK